LSREKIVAGIISPALNLGFSTMAVLGARVGAVVWELLVLLKGGAHSVTILLHVHHVLGESSEPLHIHIMLAEHVLEETRSIIQAAAAGILWLSRVQSLLMAHLSLKVMELLLVLLRARSLLTHWIKNFLNDVVVLNVDADGWSLLVVTSSDDLSSLLE